jgi:hypothetical protein
VKRLPISIHRCYDPATQAKPKKCQCNTRITREDADKFIRLGKASWCVVTRKDGTPILNRMSLVLSAEYKAAQERRFAERAANSHVPFKESFVVDERRQSDTQEDIEEARLSEIRQARHGVQARRHKVGGANHRKGITGGLKVGVYGVRQAGGVMKTPIGQVEPNYRGQRFFGKKSPERAAGRPVDARDTGENLPPDERTFAEALRRTLLATERGKQ